MPIRAVEPIELPPEPRRHRGLQRAGLSARQERWFNHALTLLVTVFAIGWVFAVAQAETGVASPVLTGSIVENPLAPESMPPIAFLVDAAARGFADETRYAGESGAVRVIVQAPGDSLPSPDSIPADARVEYAPVGTDTTTALPPGPGGVWNVLLRMRNEVRRVPDLAVITLLPLSEKKSGRIGNYVIGSWPNERGGAKPGYEPPAGLVRVTPQNQDIPVSEHFRLRDFLTKGQSNVWPKYVAMSPRLLDKLELTIDELQASGTPVQHVGVISGFRTPSYNAGGGETGGRGKLSRHMYGDAMDWFVDNDRDGRMDDLNHDGRVDRGDGRVIVEAAERVEKKHPSLIGGIGLYNPTGAHAGFVHIDTRGYRARW